MKSNELLLELLLVGVNYMQAKAKLEEIYLERLI